MSWHDQKEPPIYAEIDRVTAQKVAAMSDRALLRAQTVFVASGGDLESMGALNKAVEAAVSVALAAQDAEIAALREALTEARQIVDVVSREDFHDVRASYAADTLSKIAAALEMSGGVK